MPTASANFTGYKIFYHSSWSYDCLIYCYSGSTQVGRIEFYKEETPEASLKCNIGSDGKPTVRYRISRFKDVMQILLHEKPLYLFANGDNGMGTVGTSDTEPIGEEEP